MPKTVLIIEDSDTCSETLRIALEQIPEIAIRAASTARGALNILTGGDCVVSAVVADLQLPGMSGLDLLARLRSDPRFAALPFCIISGDSDPGLPRRALAGGADAFFAKPYSPAEVRRKLEQLLSCRPQSFG
ncbi:MAG: response regulator [Acidobacteriota bacterium]|nr:response regulator [Acidobacteriota bacterium]